VGPHGGRYVAVVAASDNLRVNPLVMQGFSQALDGGAEDLRNRLADLDGQVSETLAGWRGKSGGAYTSAWELWRRGAGEVQAGLSILERSVSEAGRVYQANEAASTQALRRVCHG
jgi:WXG100 family type VII secretion target